MKYLDFYGRSWKSRLLKVKFSRYFTQKDSFFFLCNDQITLMSEDRQILIFSLRTYSRKVTSS